MPGRGSDGSTKLANRRPPARAKPRMRDVRVERWVRRPLTEAHTLTKDFDKKNPSIEHGNEHARDYPAGEPGNTTRQYAAQGKAT